MSLIYKNIMLLSREHINLLNESKSYKVNDLVWIHFPQTGDLVQCVIKETLINKVLLSFEEKSDYYGCPDFYFNKMSIIGQSI